MPDIWMDVDAALAEVPVNIMPLVDDTDFKSREVAVAYNAAGMDLVWNFVTCAGAFTQTAVTPTTGGNYDWTHQGDGMYTIEIPASGGASINNDTEGFGWFSGVATGVLPWRGPIIGFRAAALNDALIDGGDNLDVNVTQFGGTNATATGGRPEVNASHVAGSAVSTSAAQIGVNVVNNAGTAVPAHKTFTVETSGSNSTTQIQTDLSESANDYWNGAMVLITSGALIGQVKTIGDYVGATGVLILKSGDAWTGTPADGVTGLIINR